MLGLQWGRHRGANGLRVDQNHWLDENVRGQELKQILDTTEILVVSRNDPVKEVDVPTERGQVVIASY